MLTVKVCSVMTCSLFFTLSQFIGSFSYYESDRNHCSEQANINKRIILACNCYFHCFVRYFFYSSNFASKYIDKTKATNKKALQLHDVFISFFSNTLWSLCEQYYLRIWNNCFSQVLWNHYQMQSLCNMNIHWNYLIPLIASQIWIMTSCVQTNGWVM